MSINTLNDPLAQVPIFYSFRRCPYAIRARLAIKVSGVQVELREVILADKPKEMLACSAKGTVPVLQFDDGTVIDESFDIMLWALKQNDPDNWLAHSLSQEARSLIEFNDGEFKEHLDHYKYADRFPEQTMESYRARGEAFLQRLEEQLNQNLYLAGENLSMLDVAIFPFIRQFAYVDKIWFDQTEYTKLQLWLDSLLASQLFNDVMKKYPKWKINSELVIF